MTLKQFVAKQFIDVIQWNEPEEGILAYRYPMQDMEIQNGGQLTVRESQMAAFVNEGKIADVFGPGLHTLNTRNLPVLTDLMNWDKEFESPFKSDVYFFSTHLQIDQKWGTATPITIRDSEFGAVRLRGYGIYSFRIADPRIFFTQVSGTRPTLLRWRPRRSTAQHDRRPHDRHFCDQQDFFSRYGGQSGRAGQQDRRGDESRTSPRWAWSSPPFVVENISLPEELQKVMDARIGVSMAGDLGKYTQFQAAQALPVAAANSGGAAGMGVGLGAGAAMGQNMMAAMKQPAAAECRCSGRRKRFCVDCGAGDS